MNADEARARAKARMEKALVALVERDGVIALVDALPKAIEAATDRPGAKWHDVHVVPAKDCTGNVLSMLDELVEKLEEIAYEFDSIAEEDR